MAAALCVILAALLTVPAAFAFWGQRTLTTGNATCRPSAPWWTPRRCRRDRHQGHRRDPAAGRRGSVLNQVFAGVITDTATSAGPGGTDLGAVNGLIESQVQEFIASDAFADFWVAANTRAQAALVRLLEGDESGAVSSRVTRSSWTCPR